MGNETDSDITSTPQQSPSDNSPDLTERVAQYRELIQKIVREVGEHPLCEMKRSCSLGNLNEKIEFVKDIQSIATSRIQSEKFLVVGADEKTRTFKAVENLGDFDDANVRQVLDKYLTPVPDFEILRLTTSDGCPFVLIVIPKQKQRRILAKVTVDDPTETKPRTLLREGDLWTKGGSTGKRLAKPEDWGEMYEERVRG